ncbi:MAG: hypothetical protein IIB82_11160 [Bacteroidetes bacterium]|nr:hypothetical protein [Bacteroidota bacterium]
MNLRSNFRSLDFPPKSSAEVTSLLSLTLISCLPRRGGACQSTLHGKKVFFFFIKEKEEKGTEVTSAPVIGMRSQEKGDVPGN